MGFPVYNVRIRTVRVFRALKLAALCSPRSKSPDMKYGYLDQEKGLTSVL